MDYLLSLFSKYFFLSPHFEVIRLYAMRNINRINIEPYPLYICNER